MSDDPIEQFGSTEDGSDLRTAGKQGYALADFGMAVGSGLPRVDYIEGIWRVRLIGVRLAGNPGEEASCWGENLEKTLQSYVMLLRGNRVLTPRGEDYAPEELSLT